MSLPSGHAAMSIFHVYHGQPSTIFLPIGACSGNTGLTPIPRFSRCRWIEKVQLQYLPTVYESGVVFLRHRTSRSKPVADHRVHPMVVCAEAPQLHLFAAHDLLGVAVTPLDRHVRVGVGVDKYVEGARARRELRQERHARRDLAEERRDLRLDLGLGWVRGWRCRSGSVRERVTEALVS